MTFFDCTADLVGQLNGNGQKGILQIDAPLSKISGYATSLSRHSIAAGACAAGLLLSARQAGDIGRQRPGTQQQRRRSTALSSKCGQCHVDRRG